MYKEDTTIKLDEQEASSEEVMTKFDKESKFRRLSGTPAKIVFVIAVAWSVFQLYTGLFGTFPSTLQRAPHVGAAMVLAYLLYPMNGKPSDKIPFYDYILAALAFACSAYHIVFYDQLLLRAGRFTTADMVISALAILLLLEAARRVAGLVIVCVGSVFLLYALFGNYLPGFLFHRGMTLKRLVCLEWLGTEGILGSPIYVSSSFIFLFLAFATFLKASGVGDWMTGLAMGACGGSVGGPAKAAVVASALQGTISGSSVANTVSTGSITIPLMKKSGYRPEFAGAVEAAASTGGQIMPPIMGAAAFIMTEYVGTNYGTIALAACIPALLYFTGIFTNVHFEAVKNGLLGIPKEHRPEVVYLLKTGWYRVAPIIVIVALLVMGRSAMNAAMYGIISCLIIWVIEIVRETKRFNVLEFLKKFVLCLEETARGAISVAVTCGCAGIIVGVVTATGLGLKMANGIVELAGGSLILTMVFTMLCSLILGMGVPTTANYIIQATISAPALVALGVPAIAAHMFVFYFGIVADITPPVALAAFAGAGIAKANPMKTGFNAFRLGFAAYLVPYIFVMNPVLVLVNPGWSTPYFILMVAKAIITAIIGMIGIATGFTRYFIAPCKWWESVLLVICGVLMVDAGNVTDLIGIALFAVLAGMQLVRKKGQAA
ncbi:MAG: TRAP transporter permease [[Clostridium] symbiosum]|uniref:TRAP transporter permease n=1 Tax=Clostridium symbiosum TaxID=1512 RepID=UPI0029099220|nr:TRAP transporter permease [[Clostridium] symbiosum]